MMQIKFDEEYIQPILNKKKCTTIRKGIKSYPVGELVELKVDSKPFAVARVKKLVVKRVKELNDRDAKSDGFDSKEELLDALRKIYGEIRDEEFVTIVYFEVLETNF